MPQSTIIAACVIPESAVAIGFRKDKPLIALTSQREKEVL
jgi:hypothetical protein